MGDVTFGEARLARGRPLIFLAAMLVLWSGMRFALWPQETIRAIERAIPRALLADAIARSAPSRPAPVRRPQELAAGMQVPLVRSRAFNAPAMMPAVVDGGPLRSGAISDEATLHQLMWLASVTRGDYSHPALAIAGNRGASRLPQANTRPPVRDRWAVDSWLFLRGGEGDAAAIAPRSYGASQAGLLLRYRLAPGSRFAPTAYARATASPAGTMPAELAVGASFRPLAGVPLAAQLELRLRERDGGLEARPAVAIVGGFERTMAGIEARGYGQAGYVAGTDATAFADGKLTLEKLVSAHGGFRLAAGGGAWGGAQEGAARLDIGPSASLTVATGQLTARVEADYRVRVAGRAEPGSGPSLTIAASF